jgi:CheY-like chemotaxis protein
MELKCEDCRAVIQIPDARVPQHGLFRLNCPRCKRKIEARTSLPDTRAGDQAHPGTPASLVEKPALLSDDLDDVLPEARDSVQPGRPSALLCVNRDESRSQLKVMLETSGYGVDVPSTADQALQRLRFNQYHVIVVDDDFEGKSPNPVAGYLANLNMNIRRDMFVVLMGKRFKTADHLQAFRESMDFIIHSEDLPQLATYLSRGLNEHERFYKVYNQCLIEAGKKL